MKYLDRVDHLVVACGDLEAGVRQIEERLGTRPAPGGRHPSWGTWNATISLGPTTYLEVIAPDPDSDLPQQNRPAIFHHLGAPRLNGWIANCSDIERACENAAAAGASMGEVIQGARTCPDGRELRWLISDPLCRHFDGLVPVLIDWGDTPHPASSALAGGTLQALHLAHPEPEAVMGILGALGVEMPVEHARAPSLRATIETPRGLVDLSGNQPTANIDEDYARG